MNPPKVVTTQDRVKSSVARHTELIIFTLGLLVGFLLSRL